MSHHTKERTCRLHRVGKFMLVPVAGLGLIHIPCALLLIAASIGGATLVTNLTAPGGIAEGHKEHVEQLLGINGQKSDQTAPQQTNPQQSNPHHHHHH